MSHIEPLQRVGIYALIVVGVVGAAVLQTYLERRRTKALAAAAKRLGLNFSAQGHLSQEGFASFPIFQEGRGRCCSNILRGQPEGTAGVLLFDYEYETGSGRSRQTHRQTVAALRYAKGGLPKFSLRPESLLLKIATVFGYQDIDFPERPGFSRQYLLRGSEEKSIRELFGLNLLEYFEQHPGWFLEGGGDWLVVCQHGKRMPPQAFGDFIDRAKLLLWAFPR